MHSRDIKLRALRKVVYSHYKKAGRKFPWRETHDPYKILVSEVMLQQTQAGVRTILKYKAFVKRFPSVASLAKASLKDVYSLWQGLGYNRRAKALRDAAMIIVEEHGGKVPPNRETLEALPGVGPYTAGAVLVFAFNKPEALIETNIRTVFIHHFLPNARRVHDKKLLPLIEQAIDRKNPRKWYSALMDYGSSLKKLKGNASRQSIHYTRQTIFKGSVREVRGKILKALAVRSATKELLSRTLKVAVSKLEPILATLVREEMVVKKARTYGLP